MLHDSSWLFVNAFFAPPGIGLQNVAYDAVPLSSGTVPTLSESASFLRRNRRCDSFMGAVGVILPGREGVRIRWRTIAPLPEGIA